MPDAARERIQAKIDDRLAAIVAPDGRYEAEPTGDPDVFPALHTFDGGQRVIEGETGATRYSMTITVEGYIEAGSGAAGRAARNSLYAQVVAAMMTEPPFDGDAETIEEVGDLRTDNPELASVRRLAFAQDFEITYATERGDPTQFA